MAAEILTERQIAVLQMLRVGPRYHARRTTDAYVSSRIVRQLDALGMAGWTSGARWEITEHGLATLEQLGRSVR